MSQCTSTHLFATWDRAYLDNTASLKTGGVLDNLPRQSRSAGCLSLLNSPSPTVSQICSLTSPPSQFSFLVNRLALIVDLFDPGRKVPSAYLLASVVFPTPVSVEYPEMRTILDSPHYINYHSPCDPSNTTLTSSVSSSLPLLISPLTLNPPLNTPVPLPPFFLPRLPVARLVEIRTPFSISRSRCRLASETNDMLASTDRRVRWRESKGETGKSSSSPDGSEGEIIVIGWFGFGATLPVVVELETNDRVENPLPEACVLVDPCKEVDPNLSTRSSEMVDEPAVPLAGYIPTTTSPARYLCILSALSLSALSLAEPPVVELPNAPTFPCCLLYMLFGVEQPEPDNSLPSIESYNRADLEEDDPVFVAWDENEGKA